MKQAILVYSTCKNRQEATMISTRLLECRLAVCVAIVDPVSSIYFWPPKTNKVTKGEEAIILIKTFRSKWRKVEKEIHDLHSYDTPLIIAIPLQYVSRKYFKWMEKEIT